jgi:hypothetical protein
MPMSPMTCHPACLGGQRMPNRVVQMNCRRRRCQLIHIPSGTYRCHTRRAAIPQRRARLPSHTAQARGPTIASTGLDDLPERTRSKGAASWPKYRCRHPTRISRTPSRQAQRSPPPIRLRRAQRCLMRAEPTARSAALPEQPRFISRERPRPTPSRPGGASRSSSGPRPPRLCSHAAPTSGRRAESSRWGPVDPGHTAGRTARRLQLEEGLDEYQRHG